MLGAVSGRPGQVRAGRLQGYSHQFSPNGCNQAGAGAQAGGWEGGCRHPPCHPLSSEEQIWMHQRCLFGACCCIQCTIVCTAANPGGIHTLFLAARGRFGFTATTPPAVARQYAAAVGAPPRFPWATTTRWATCWRQRLRRQLRQPFLSLRRSPTALPCSGRTSAARCAASTRFPALPCCERTHAHSQSRTYLTELPPVTEA